MAATLAAVTALSCTSATAFADRLKTVDGVTYRYSDSGDVNGKYTGWAKTSKGRYYCKDGVKVRNTWIKNKKGECRYLGSDGRMVTGWYDVKQGKEGRFSWFNENGVWDGQTYYSHYDEYEGFGNTVTIKVARNEIISESMSRYLDNGLGSEKKARSYVLDNTGYELEIPLAVADQLTVGDKLIVSPNVKRGEKVDGEYQYKLCIQTLYSPNKGDETYRYNKDSGTILEEVTDARLELFNKLLVLKSGKLKLDMMFKAYGLDWKWITGDEFDDYLRDHQLYSNVLSRNNGYFEKEYAYGLFGGYNEKNEDTGKYVFRNNMSEKRLLKLLKEQTEANKNQYKLDLESEDDIGYHDYFMRSLHLWLDVTVTEIPELPLSASKRKFVGPPELTVISGAVSAKAYEGTSSWENTYTDIGISVGQTDDSVGPLHSRAAEHPITVNVNEPVKLSFATDAAPAKITVKCWDSKYIGDDSAYEKYEAVQVNDMSFTPKKGSRIYEIYASWSKFTENDVEMSGNCRYTIYIKRK